MGRNFNYKEILNDIAHNEGKAKALTEEDSARLKDCLYEMAADLDERCREHGIKLFLVGGTLLGAVRHHGFIPWDDDIDLGLFREDYEKLKVLFNDYFSDSYELRCPNSEYPNGNRFMQIFKKGTVLKTVSGENPLRPQSVYIDVFPYDFVPENPILREFKGLKANIYMLIASCVMDEVYMNESYKKYLSKSDDGQLYLKIRRIIGKAFSWRSPEKWFDFIDHSIQNKRSNLVTSATGRKHYFGEIYSYDVFEPLAELEFVNHKFYAPGKWHEYLEGNYGKNYMVPPPENKRESHFIIELSL